MGRLNLSRLACVGTWLSLVEHSLGVRGVGSSNLPVPTIISSIPCRLCSEFRLRATVGAHARNSAQVQGNRADCAACFLRLVLNAKRGRRRRLPLF